MAPLHGLSTSTPEPRYPDSMSALGWPQPVPRQLLLTLEREVLGDGDGAMAAGEPGPDRYVIAV